MSQEYWDLFYIVQYVVEFAIKVIFPLGVVAITVRLLKKTA